MVGYTVRKVSHGRFCHGRIYRSHKPPTASIKHQGNWTTDGLMKKYILPQRFP